MSNNPEHNGWNEWSRHVLKELERLNDNIGAAREEIHSLKNEITKVKSMQYGLDELKNWRKDVTEVVSSSQLKEMKDSVESLKINIAENKNIFQDVHDLKEWRKIHDDIASVSKMKEMSHELEKLKTFRNYSVAVFVIFQIAITIIIKLL